MDNDTPSFGWPPQRGTKRSYDDIETHPRRTRSTNSPSWRMDGPSRTRPSDFNIQLPPIQPRWIGDGLDFRRPMRSSNSPASSNNSYLASNTGTMNIIDLTNDDAEPARPSVAPRTDRSSRRSSPHPPALGTFGQASRGPRFPQEIIDLSADSPEVTTRPLPQPTRHHYHSPRSAETQSEGDGSPDVEFLSARILPEPERTAQPTVLRDPFHPARYSNQENDDDDVEITAARTVLDAAENMIRRISAVSIMSRRPRRPEVIRNTRLIFAGASRVPRTMAERDAVRIQFTRPDMDFGQIAFDMGFNFGNRDDRADTASPPVVPPSAAPAGFTRSPAEGDALICPNCEDELCTGESDLKKQVWIVKACGHVYCGECTAYRSLSKNKKAKSGTKAFSTCVVDNCGKQTKNGRQMIQLFL